MNYRCVYCRKCTACKDSGRTEAILLREEAEMEKINLSVKLGLPNKRIICTLPLRDDERDYTAFKKRKTRVKLSFNGSNSKVT